MSDVQRRLSLLLINCDAFVTRDMVSAESSTLQHLYIITNEDDIAAEVLARTFRLLPPPSDSPTMNLLTTIHISARCAVVSPNQELIIVPSADNRVAPFLPRRSRHLSHSLHRLETRPKRTLLQQRLRLQRRLRPCRLRVQVCRFCSDICDPRHTSFFRFFLCQVHSLGSLRRMRCSGRSLPRHWWTGGLCLPCDRHHG